LKIVGLNSRFWEKLVYISPPFKGSEAEAERNISSHTWQTIHLATRYPEASDDWDPIEECNKCGVLGESKRSHYTCGTAPPAKKITE